MALKAKLTKEEFDALSDELKAHYKVTGEGYALDTDAGSDLKEKLDEFRNNNVALMKEQEKLQAQVKQFEGIDPEKAREAQAKLHELEEKKMLDDGQIDELVNKRTERMRSDFENKYKALEERNAHLESRTVNTESQLHAKMVESGIANAVSAVGTVRKGAMPDILARAGSVWKLDDELNLVAMRGDQPMIGADGKTPLTPEEYATSLLQDAPFFFEGSSGSGAGGNDTANANNQGGKTIAHGDKAAFGSNLEDIASGKVQVG